MVAASGFDGPMNPVGADPFHMGSVRRSGSDIYDKYESLSGEMIFGRAGT